MRITSSTPIADILDNPTAREVLERLAPQCLALPFLSDMREMPIGMLLQPSRILLDTGVIGVTEDASERVWSELSVLEFEDPEPNAHELRANPDYQDASVELGSADVHHPATCPRWDMFEVRLDGPSHGNPFVDVDFGATFTDGTESSDVGGFYDGDGRYVVRFLPPAEGRWFFSTSSTARCLHGVSGEFRVTAPAAGVHGPVRVADQFHFAHDDGTRYRPFGTTAYAWTSQDDDLERRTLATLAGTPFNKLRMCVFPKSFMYNDNDPEQYAFSGSVETGWDTERFNPEFFRHLERRIAQLGELGIQADLIILHPYDRWGFSRLGMTANSRYIQYLVRRLAAYHNVWWSMANEYDLLPSLATDDWETLAQVVVANDPVGHLISIHNWFTNYDHSRPWITHCSLQADSRSTPEETSLLRTRWGKPIVIDEFGYEGDLDQGWGCLTGEEFVRRCWEAVVRGGYVTHGETYLNDQKEIFWSKGGELVGESVSRIAFLADLIAESPTGRVDPIHFGPINWDVPYGGVPDRYYLAYLGANQRRFRVVRMPEGQQYHVDIIDTWKETVNRLDGTYSGTFRLDLPARPYQALRFVRADATA